MRNTEKTKRGKTKKTPQKKEEAIKPNYEQKARHPSEIRRGL
jgi:hypothetical protein